MIKKFLAAIVTVSVLAVGLASHAYAVDVFPRCSTDTQTSTICTATSDKLLGPGSIWNRILETFTFIIGAVSVLMIVVGGIRYVTSAGEQANIKAAKDTILYAVVGVVVAMLAYSIVHFVITNI
jgi:cytochrome bd-type quinol oxidase subunit 2